MGGFCYFKILKVILNHYRLGKRKHSTVYSIALYICVVEPVLAAVAHIAVVSDMEKKRGRERHRGNNILCLM